MRHSFARIYFNLVYNRLYDATTARLLRYVQAQERITALLDVAPGQRILCVGLGTGNELRYLSGRASGLDLIGVDFSGAGLRRALGKYNGAGRSGLCLMDANSLGFRDNSFDRVLAYHLTDFLRFPECAAREMIRVLKPGGRFVISFPSKPEGFGLGAGLISHGFATSETAPGTRLGQALTTLLTGLAYMPLLLRPRPFAYSRADLSALLVGMGGGDVALEEDAVYQDYVASGIKTTGGES